MHTPSTLSFDGARATVLDQTALPHRRDTVTLESLDAVARAIRGMQVRGAPLIGATAACGVAIALRHCADDAALAEALSVLAATRPTAVNLHWALDRLARVLGPLPTSERAASSRARSPNGSSMRTPTPTVASAHGLALIRAIAASRPGRCG